MSDLSSPREAYGDTLVKLGRENPDLVVLDADLSHSTMTLKFAEAFPQRFFNCGIAEQNMMGIAAGLASCGKTVFASTFAVFAAGRAFDQLRVSIAQPCLNVKVVATHGGISVGEDGASHHAVEDLALISSLPGFTIVVPADAIETGQAVKVAAATCGPFYIRLTRPKVPALFDESYRFTLGRAVEMHPGKDLTVIALGIMVAPALEAARELAGEGLGCRLLNMSTLKPLDREAVLQAARETGAILCVEEHLQHGGLGSAVAQVVAEGHPVPMAFVAIQDTYAKSGKAEELLQRHGLTASDIARAARKLWSRKRG